MNYVQRINNLRQKIKTANVDAFITFHCANYFYLSGFTGSSGAIIITETEQFLLTDSRYILQAKTECSLSNVDVIIHTDSLITACISFLKQSGCTRIGFEADHLLVSELQMLKTAELQFIPLTNFVETLRYVKDASEIAILRKVAQIGEAVLEDTLATIKVGMTEIDVAMHMEIMMPRLGASGPSFDTIVVSGMRGALPHGKPSDKVITSGDLITIDFGVQYQGYCSDMTRTFAIGAKPSTKLVEMYEVVLNAQLAAINVLKAGMLSKDIDTVARQVIADAGYGQYFGHSLGHAVGIEIHEVPLLGQSSNMELLSGMIVTIEPGIYIEGLGGIRIEDTLLVTATGSENFMTLPKSLIIV